MKLTLEKVIGAIVLRYMIYTHFLSRPTMVKIQKDKHQVVGFQFPFTDRYDTYLGPFPTMYKDNFCQTKFENCLKHHKNRNECYDRRNICG